MKRHSIAAAAVAAGLIFALVPGHLVKASEEGSSKATEIHVLMSTGLKAPMETVRAQAEKAIGHRLKIEYGPSLDLKPMIEAGAPVDVALLTPAAIDDLVREGKIVAGSRVDVARAPVGIGQRGEAPKGDVSTLDGLKRTLLNAKSVFYVPNGASLAAVQKTFARLGIVEQMKAKTVVDERPTPLKPGETELTIRLASEILPNHQLVFLGNLPAEVQIPVVLSLGVGAKSSNVDAAKALIRFLQGPAIEPALKANGMERPRESHR